MLTVSKYLLFDVPWIGTYDRVCLKGFKIEQAITQFEVKSCLMSILFLWDEEDNYFTREAELILYMTWISIGLEYLHKKVTFTKLYCLNVKRLFSMFL